MNQAASTLLLILATFGIVLAAGCARSVHSLDVARARAYASGNLLTAHESLTDLSRAGQPFLRRCIA